MCALKPRTWAARLWAIVWMVSRRSSPTTKWDSACRRHSPGKPMRTSGAMLSWIFSGMFLRYPKLKIALSEGEIGWIPYFLERAEQVLDKQKHWVMKGQTFMDHAATDVNSTASRSAT